jgi:hypothetical protein
MNNEKKIKLSYLKMTDSPISFEIRKHQSEIIHSEIDLYNMNLENNYPQKAIEEQSKDNILLESFTEDVKFGKSPRAEALNFEEISMDPSNMNNFMKNIMMSNRLNNKCVIKTITQKFHDLYLKLVNQVKMLKTENSNLKKNIDFTSKLIENKNVSAQDQTDINIESDGDAYKYLMQEEIECFNEILFDFNVQFNEVQSQEEILRRDILKKHREIEKLNFDIDDAKKQKEILVKELQNIAFRLKEMKPKTEQFDMISETQYNLYQQSEFTTEKEYEEENDYEEELQAIINDENQEYLIKKILQENKKYKSIVRVMKSEEAEFQSLINQMEAEIENLTKFKNYLLTKVNPIEDNISKCIKMIDSVSEKVNNIEFKLEMDEEALNYIR